MRDLEFILELSVGLSEMLDDIQSEIAYKNSLLAESPDPQRQQVLRDIAFSTRLQRAIEGFRRDTLTQLKRMADAQAPYSELVRAWISKYLS
ncbi:hypothetical protein ORS3428_26485 [Mesorhizobium sp. ORS 3428]|nr:hypothetical protein ORS3428_26485 [Mesorhizobium sp. ORS 3428]